MVAAYNCCSAQPREDSSDEPFQTKAAPGAEKPALAHGPVRHRVPRLNLALQGGGAHGAFTWGVLDRLLEDTGLEFEGLSGSSAGAMNAVVMADGWLEGGRAGARRALASFWTEVGRLMPPGLVVQGGGEAIHLSTASKLLASWAGISRRPS